MALPTLTYLAARGRRFRRRVPKTAAATLPLGPPDRPHDRAALRCAFISAGTNVGFTVTVHDTAFGATQIYTNQDLQSLDPGAIRTELSELGELGAGWPGGPSGVLDSPPGLPPSGRGIAALRLCNL
jgi:hypothetical protein